MISGNEQFERDFEAFLKEDDSRLAALYRKLPQPEPDAKLDAAVLAMAHRTLNPHLVATPLASTPSRRRARWLAPIGAAAGLVLAAGVALRLGPQVWSEHNAPAPATMRDNGVIQVRPIDEAAPPPPASPPPPPAEAPAAAAPASSMSMQAAHPMKPKAEPAPVAREVVTEEAQQQATAAAPIISADRADVDAKALKKVENAASPAAPPQAFPGSGRRAEMDAVERKQAIATGAWQKLHENETAGGAPAGMVAPKPAATRDAPAPAAALDATVTAPQPAARAKTTAAPEAARTTTTAAQADAAAAPQEQEKFSETRQTPYSAELMRNSRLYPESWVAAIQRLVQEGRRDEALQNLQLFHKKYPNYRLPSDLKQLSASQK
jgi:hypothetical protein